MHYVLPAVLLGVAWSAAVVQAQAPSAQSDPAELELLVSDAPSKPGNGQRVLVKDDAGEVVVANVLAENGNRLIVVMPSGRLKSLPAIETTPTPRPFTAATKEELQRAYTSQQFKGFRSRATRRFVYVYNTSEPFQKATSTLLETMYPKLVAYCQREKLDVHEPELPMVVIMFRTQDEYEKFSRAPDGMAAFYSPVTNYVVMYEQSKLTALAPDLAVKQSIAVIAHEGVHQILFNIGVQQRLSRWPMWISEGLPEFFAPTQTDKGVRWKGVGLVNDLRQHTLLEYFKQRGAAQPGELIREVVSAKQLTAEGYAVAWGLVHYLEKMQQDNFFAYLREVSQLGPLEEPPADNLPLFTKHFGSDLARLEEGLLKHLQKMPYVDPIENQTHFVGMLITSGRKSAMVTTSPAALSRWRDELAAELPGNERNSAKLNVQSFPNRKAAAAFANGWLLGR
jgi:hypothetical protein